MARGGPIPSGGATELDRLRQAVSAHFPVYETRVGPQSVLFAVHVDRASLEGRFEALRRELGALGYVPILRREVGEEFVEVLRKPRFGPRRIWVNLLLLGATVATTVFAGGMIWVTYVGRNVLAPTDFLYGALYFALPLLAILGVHESAHYVVARRRHLDASLPYFIPIPPPYILGTFGAFVSIREPFPDRKTLFDVGVSGPLAGFAMSLPIALAGLSLSLHAPTIPANYCGPSILGQSYGNLLLGPSLLWAGLSAFFPSSILSLHPLALAGWVGVLITAINLLPAGSLDGGHVFRALAGERARYVSYAAAAALFALGIFYIGWLLFAFVVLLLGLRHPPPLNDTTPLDRKRIALGILTAGLLVTGFVLVPLSTPPGALTLHDGSARAVSPPPGASIAADLGMLVTNDDPVPHALLYTYEIGSVSTSAGTDLNGSALAAWEATAVWTFSVPGHTIPPIEGPSATLPQEAYLTVNGTATVNATVSFSNNATALSVVFAIEVFELCATAGTGTASTSLPPASFP